MNFHYLGKWCWLATQSKAWCKGYLRCASQQFGPRNAYRIVDSHRKVIEEIPAVDDCEIGMIAGFPSPEQYEAAAQRALEAAARIREREKKDGRRIYG